MVYRGDCLWGNYPPSTMYLVSTDIPCGGLQGQSPYPPPSPVEGSLRLRSQAHSLTPPVGPPDEIELRGAKARQIQKFPPKISESTLPKCTLNNPYNRHNPTHHRAFIE
jgi:hypothetical protein